MNRYIIAFVSLCVFSFTCHSRMVDGVVVCDRKGLKDVIISDGESFVLSDRKGRFTMEIKDDAEFVFILTPSGYMADWSDGVPAFYLEAAGRDFFEFRLEKFMSGSDYNLVVMADPQTHDSAHFSKFMAEPITDISATVGLLDGVAIGLTLGDICWDKIGILEEYKTGILRAGIPFYPVIGNHDHMAYCQGDKNASAEYREFMGPENYAFFVGRDVVIVLDNIIYDTNFALELGYSPSALNWVRQLMDLVSSDSDVFIAQHANCVRPYGRIRNLDALVDIMKGHKVTVLSGHTHVNGNRQLAENVTEHNIAAVCGAWWDTIHSIDGTPRGYKVYSKNDGMLSWYYKPVDFSSDHIAEIFLPGQGLINPDSVIVNVWDWDESWIVEWYRDGVYMGNMQPVEEISPIYVKEINAAYSHYGVEIPSWKRERPCSHYFATSPVENAKEIRIVVVSRFGVRWERTVVLPE